MSRMLSWRPLTATVILALFGAAFLVHQLIRSAAGADFVLDQLATRAKIGLTTTNLSGDLSRGLGAEEVRIELESGSVILRGLDSKWSLDLEARRLVVNSLEVESVEYLQSQASPEESPLELPSLDFGWGLRIEQLRATTLSVTSLAEPTPSTLENLELGASLENGKLEVSRLSVNTEDLQLDLFGTLDTTANYSHSVEAATRLTTIEAGEFELELNGDLDSTSMSAHAPHWNTELRAEVSDLLGNPSIELQVESRAEPLEYASIDVSGTLPEVQATGEIGLFETTIDLSSLEATVDADHILVTGSIEIREAGVSIEIEQARLGSEVLVASRWTWDGLEGSALGETAGRLAINGSLPELTVDAAGIVPINGQPFEFVLRAGLGETHAEISEFRFADQASKVELDGKISWANGVTIDATGQARNLDPSILFPDWSASIDSQFTMTGDQERLEVNLPHLAGGFLGRPLEGSGRAVLREFELGTASIDLKSGSSRLRISAPDWPAKPMHARAEIDHLGDLFPNSSGKFEIDLEASSSKGGHQFVGSFSGTSLSWKDWSIEGLASTATIDLRPGANNAAEFRIEGVDGPVEIDRLTLQATGLDRRLDFQLTSQSQLGDSEAMGRFFLESLPRIELDHLTLQTDDLGGWQLEQPMLVSHSNQIWGFDRPFCLASVDRPTESGHLCIDLPRSADREGPGMVEIKALPLGLFSGFASAAAGHGIELEGRLDGRFDWLFESESVWISGSVENHGLKISRPDGQQQVLELDGWSLSVDGQQDAQIELRLDAPHGHAHLHGDIFDWMSPDRATINLALDLDLPALDQLDLEAGPVDNLRGAIAAQLHATGQLQRPAVVGALNLSSLALEVPATGMVLENGNIEADLSPSGEAIITGRMDLGDGSVELSGTARLDPSSPMNALISAHANDAVILDSSGSLVTIDADLDLEFAEPAIALRGSVGVKDSRLVIGPVQQTIRASPDVVFVHPDQDEPETELQFVTDIEVFTENSIDLSGYGLDAEVTGRINVSNLADQPSVARGSLRLGGLYRIYGQELEISRGEVNFDESTLTSPLLNIEATRKTDSAVAGVRIRGEAERPIIELFSSPPLPESEVLSLLILGYSMADPSQREAGALSAALLGLRMGSGIAVEQPSFMEKLGFTQFGLDVSNDVGGAAFSVGRYLSPKLFLSYSIGLSESTEILALDYELTDRFSVGAESGEETRATIRYRVESGKPKSKSAPDQDR